jgi:hypothetical protein
LLSTNNVVPDVFDILYWRRLLEQGSITYNSAVYLKVMLYFQNCAHLKKKVTKDTFSILVFSFSTMMTFLHRHRRLTGSSIKVAQRLVGNYYFRSNTPNYKETGCKCLFLVARWLPVVLGLLHVAVLIAALVGLTKARSYSLLNCICSFHQFSYQHSTQQDLNRIDLNLMKK